MLQWLHILFDFHLFFNTDILAIGLYPFAPELVLLVVSINLLNPSNLSLLGHSDLIRTLVTLVFIGLLLWLIIMEPHFLDDVLLLFLLCWNYLVRQE